MIKGIHLQKHSANKVVKFLFSLRIAPSPSPWEAHFSKTSCKASPAQLSGDALGGPRGSSPARLADDNQACLQEAQFSEGSALGSELRSRGLRVFPPGPFRPLLPRPRRGPHISTCALRALHTLQSTSTCPYLGVLVLRHHPDHRDLPRAAGLGSTARFLGLGGRPLCGHGCGGGVRHWGPGSCTEPAAAGHTEVLPLRREGHLRAARVKKGPGGPAVASATLTPLSSRRRRPPAEIGGRQPAGC